MSVKLIANDSGIDKSFKSMYQGIITKTKNSASEDWIVIETILKLSIKILECALKYGTNKGFIAILYQLNDF